jgi:hypothetical protein
VSPGDNAFAHENGDEKPAVTLSVAELYFDERKKDAETAMTIWKLEGKEAICEIFTARGSKGGKRNPKLRYFLQLIPRQGEQRIQIRISKEEADHCMSLRTKAEQVDWLAEKIARASDSGREKK